MLSFFGIQTISYLMIRKLQLQNSYFYRKSRNIIPSSGYKFYHVLSRFSDVVIIVIVIVITDILNRNKGKRLRNQILSDFILSSCHLGFEPSCYQCTLSLPFENITKPQGFLICFQWVAKWCIGNKRVN